MHLGSGYFISTDENTIATENRKLQARIKQLEKERIKLQQAQVLTDKTNRTCSLVAMTVSYTHLEDFRGRYAEEYRRGHNGRELSDIESEDDDVTGTSLDFSSAVSEPLFKSTSNSQHFTRDPL